MRKRGAVAVAVTDDEGGRRMAGFQIEDSEYDAPGVADLSLAAYGLFVKLRGYALRHHVDLIGFCDVARIAAACSHPVRIPNAHEANLANTRALLIELRTNRLIRGDDGQYTIIPLSPDEKRRQAARLRMRRNRSGGGEQDANALDDVGANESEPSRARAPRANEVSESEVGTENPEGSQGNTQAPLPGVGAFREGEGRGAVAAEGRKAVRGKRAGVMTTWPNGLALTDELRRWALAGGLDAELEWTQFSLHHQSKGSRFVDWPKAFKGWCMRSKLQFGRGKGARA